MANSSHLLSLLFLHWPTYHGGWGWTHFGFCLDSDGFNALLDFWLFHLITGNGRMELQHSLFSALRFHPSVSFIVTSFIVFVWFYSLSYSWFDDTPLHMIRNLDKVFARPTLLNWTSGFNKSSNQTIYQLLLLNTWRHKKNRNKIMNT